MVRCKSLVEATRVQIVEVMSGEDADMASRAENDETGDETADETGNETETDTHMFGTDDDNDEDDPIGMHVAKVYEKTIMQLGEIFGAESMFGGDSNA